LSYFLLFAFRARAADPIALAETFPASAITPLDKTWSKVFAAAIATDQFARLRLATHLLS
jgi:hypothetical protein